MTGFKNDMLDESFHQMSDSDMKMWYINDYISIECVNVHQSNGISNKKRKRRRKHSYSNGVHRIWLQYANVTIVKEQYNKKKQSTLFAHKRSKSKENFMIYHLLCDYIWKMLFESFENSKWLLGTEL